MSETASTLDAHRLQGESPSEMIARHVRYGLVIVKLRAKSPSHSGDSYEYLEQPAKENGHRLCSIEYFAPWRSLKVGVGTYSRDGHRFEFWDTQEPYAEDIMDTQYGIQEGSGDLTEVLNFLHRTYLRIMESAPTGSILLPKNTL